MSDSPQLAVVMVAKAECLRCEHLAGPLGSEKYPCIEDDNCPARFYRIASGVPVHKYGRILARAMAEGDAAKVSKVTNKLTKLDPAISAKVMALASGTMHEFVED